MIRAGFSLQAGWSSVHAANSVKALNGTDVNLGYQPLTLIYGRPM